MSLFRSIGHKCLSSLPFLSLLSVCIAQWFMAPSTGFYLIFDKMVLFYWLIYRPDRISIFLVTMLYLVLDIKEGWSLGFSPLTTLLIIWFVLLQRHVLLGQTFLLQWVAFGFVMLVYFVALYVTYQFLMDARLDLLPVAISLLVGILLFPLVFRILSGFSVLVPIYAELEE